MQRNQRSWPAAVLLVLLAITGCSQTPTSGPVTPTPGPVTPTLQAMTPTPLPPATVEKYPWPPTRRPAPTRTPTPTETPLPPTVPPTPAPTTVPPTPLPPYAPKGELPARFPPVVYVVQRPQQAAQIWSLQYKQDVLYEELLVDLAPTALEGKIDPAFRFTGSKFVEKLSVSPDGCYVGITIVETGSYSEVSLIVSIDGNGALFLPARTGIILSWIANDEQVLMVDQFGSYAWGVRSFDGTEITRFPLMPIVDAAVTSDGERIVFSAIPVENNWMGAVDVDGRELVYFSVPDPLPGHRIQNLAISPDDQSCAFTWSESATYYGGGPIWVMDVNGTNQRSLGSSDTYDFDLVWSPDGRTIAFSRREDPEGAITTYDRSTLVSSLWLIDVENGEERQLLSSEGQHSNWSPQWLPDGSGLVFLSNRGGDGNVWFVRPDGSGLQQLTRQGGVVGELALLPR